MSVYTSTYGSLYGNFPDIPLDAEVDLNLGGTWTDISTYAYQREGTAPAIEITRGRPDETSKATPSGCKMQWNNRDGRFTRQNPTGPYYGVLTQNTPVRVSVPWTGTYLRFEDDQVSFTGTPGLSLNPAGDLELQIDLQPSAPLGTLAAPVKLVGKTQEQRPKRDATRAVRMSFLA